MMEWETLLRISSKEVESQDATLVRAAATELVKGIALLSQDERRKMWLVRSGAAALANEEGVDIFKIEMETETGTAEDAARASKSNDNDNDERADMVRGSAYFRKLIGLGYDGNSLESAVTKQIEKDVHRSGLGTDEQPLLKRTLFAYAVRNRDVGYVQGMNFIVARCARESFSEEQCFWMLAAIVERVLPKYFDQQLSGVRVDNSVVSRLLEKHNPSLKAVLEKHGVETQGQIASMLMTIFENNVSSDAVGVVWDFIFLFSFERFGFALIMTFFEFCEYLLPDSSGSAESFDVEMIMMDALQRWRKMSGSATRQILISRALEWTIERFPDADAIRSMRASARHDMEMTERLRKNPHLALQHAQAETLRIEMKLIRTKLTRPLLSSSGTALVARKAMRALLDSIVDSITHTFPDLKRRNGRSMHRYPSRQELFRRVSSRIGIEKPSSSEYELLVDAAADVNTVASGLPTELKAAMPKLVDNLSDLASKLYDASERAEPARQLVASILKSLETPDTARYRTEESAVTALLVVKRWLQETDLWSCIPEAYKKELQRVLVSVTLLLSNHLRTHDPKAFGALESALVRALRGWKLSASDCFLFTPPSPPSSAVRVQWQVLLAHRRLVNRIRSLTQRTSGFRKNALDPFDQLLRILLREHEKKMATANFVHSALKCLERVKRLLKEDGSSFAGIAADIELAKHYAQKIPDPKWRNSLIGRSEKFSEKLHGMRSLRGNGESQNAQ